MDKKAIIRHLETIATYMELRGDSAYRIAAYRKAANGIERDKRSVDEIEKWTALNGVGEKTTTVIEEFLQTGQTKLLTDLKKEVPVGLIPLLQLPGIGGKKLAKLHKELGIIDVQTLQRACEEGKVQALDGFGVKTEENLLAALKQAMGTRERHPFAYARPIAEHILQKLREFPAVQRAEVAGSFRRVQETVKDLDFIVETDEPEEVRDWIVNWEEIVGVIAKGTTKVSVRWMDEHELSIDVRLAEPAVFATTLHHFTGSKDHNVRMRQLAKQRGEKISEYGVTDDETNRVTTFSNEQAFYHHFHLPWFPPELRETGEEIDHSKRIHDVISIEDIRGDLHMHTAWSDGAHTIEEMIEACRRKEYEVMAITDHSRSLVIAGGLSIDNLLRQHEEIVKLRETYRDITILSGVEMDILADGALDYPDEVLRELDWIIGSIHSHFHQSKELITRRFQAACENPYVKMIAHPSGRKIGIRDGYHFDIENFLEIAHKTGTAVECNANPNRFDLRSDWLQKAVSKGVPIVINTDAHNQKELDNMTYGVSQAKKGWVPKTSVLNTWSVQQILQLKT